MNVPAPLVRLMPYAKFAVAVAGLAATAVIALVAAPPAWVYLVISAATALGVRQVPNKDISVVFQDGLTAVRAGEAAVSDVRRGDLTGAGGQATIAWHAATDAVQAAEQIAGELPKP